MTTAKTDAGETGALRVPKMAELVAQRLRRQIVRGELSEGDALPSEAELMAQFGVSRPTLREAFRVLESEGLINVRRGAHGGARVQTPNGDIAARYAGLVLEFRGTTLEDVYDARNIIEPPLAGLLARKRTNADLEKLKAAHDAAREHLDDGNALIRVHNEFHAVMIDLAGNQTMAVLNGMVRHIIDLSSFRHVASDAGSPANIASIRKGFRAHELLIQYVEARDAVAAEKLWRKHVTEAEKYMLSDANPKTVLDLLE
ncbi:FadR/GntR family transcriptional regulator [Gordonia polyisoprenivorans]|uniref:FadR/GntR family transcriptional regulator n=1 Tax=Gordonia polyisoprenivorans TaxID=84595 RepID=UPI001AD6ECC2|nr:GntR family transcriptional regulator [Gordonia polyisoprenivorans]QTI70981.1 FadR family transcriptional regulator [Gordonia polyisoprenivorans]